MDIWAAAGGAAVPGYLRGQVLRMVESQEQVATTSLVDTLAEQGRLEELLEGAKPALAPDTAGLHYLLATPFRYPPLTHGSRFGTRREPSLFYGSRARSAVLAETAYYRFVFWQDMAVPPPAGRLLTQHTLFSATYATDRGLRLQAPPFDAFRAQLTSPSDYRATQRLGAGMRAARVEAIEYRSARDPQGGINVALFVPGALASRRPLYQRPWLCEVRPESVTLSTPAEPGSRRLELSAFLVAGRLPRPAT